MPLKLCAAPDDYPYGGPRDAGPNPRTRLRTGCREAALPAETRSERIGALRQEGRPRTSERSARNSKSSARRRAGTSGSCVWCSSQPAAWRSLAASPLPASPTQSGAAALRRRSTKPWRRRQRPPKPHRPPLSWTTSRARPRQMRRRRHRRLSRPLRRRCRRAPRRTRRHQRRLRPSRLHPSRRRPRRSRLQHRHRPPSPSRRWSRRCSISTTRSGRQPASAR